jgi:hypothetical protein
VEELWNKNIVFSIPLELTDVGNATHSNYFLNLVTK